MAETTDRETGAWASLLLRLAISALFIAAVVPKFSKGQESLNGVVKSFQTMFEKTWLPPAMVTMHARVTPFIEVLIPIWLLTGFRLKLGWFVTGLFLVSLSFGMTVAGKGDVAAHNFNYVLMAAIGLYLSRFDRFNIESFSHGK
jgi:uncharacterized membrane protein YphA (DoxX/SURF4 family)